MAESQTLTAMAGFRQIGSGATEGGGGGGGFLRGWSRCGSTSREVEVERVAGQPRGPRLVVR
jgi:hypothetical protein